MHRYNVYKTANKALASETCERRPRAIKNKIWRSASGKKQEGQMSELENSPNRKPVKCAFWFRRRKTLTPYLPHLESLLSRANSKDALTRRTQAALGDRTRMRIRQRHQAFPRRILVHRDRVRERRLSIRQLGC